MQGEVDETLRNRVARLDLATQLPNEFLMMTDRFSMAHSLEARTPLLDHQLVEAVYSIPAHRRLSSSVYKPMLRRVVKDLLPPELMSAPKRGFVIPLKLWIKSRLRPVLVWLLEPGRLRCQGIVREDFYECYVLPHILGKQDNTHQIWTMLMFQLWWEVHIEKTSKDFLKAWLKNGEAG